MPALWYAGVAALSALSTTPVIAYWGRFRGWW